MIYLTSLLVTLSNDYKADLDFIGDAFFLVSPIASTKSSMLLTLAAASTPWKPANKLWML